MKISINKAMSELLGSTKLQPFWPENLGILHESRQCEALPIYFQSLATLPSGLQSLKLAAMFSGDGAPARNKMPKSAVPTTDPAVAAAYPKPPLPKMEPAFPKPPPPVAAPLSESTLRDGRQQRVLEEQMQGLQIGDRRERHETHRLHQPQLQQNAAAATAAIRPWDAEAYRAQTKAPAAATAATAATGETAPKATVKAAANSAAWRPRWNQEDFFPIHYRMWHHIGDRPSRDPPAGEVWHCLGVAIVENWACVQWQHRPAAPPEPAAARPPIRGRAAQHPDSSSDDRMNRSRSRSRSQSRFKGDASDDSDFL